MLQVVYLFVFITSVALNFLGMIMSLLITVVIYKTWVKSHRISSSDRILFSLGISRFLMLGLFLLNIFYFIASNAERSEYILAFFFLFWRFLDSSSLWFVTLLNCLYCVKITNFQHSVFLLLKRIVSQKITRLLLVCMLISVITTFLFLVLRWISHFSEFVTGRNGTLFDLNKGILTLVVSLVLNSLFQFILNVTSASLLIHSLRKHVRRMERNSTGFWNPQTEAHVGAMKTMIYFLILYVPYSAATLLIYLPSYTRMGPGVRTICMIISSLYPLGHSILIILTHPQLKTKAKKIVCFNK
ncbi:PREDICTED: taste receptor type 2 member 4 [Chinchilla lanigera]|uniref:taste receptor type 2 member 4 n=1 Tax=Chinchilla lanigera TaxID=34839 RepID=UPI00038EE090|nr:PREDICTED: taste receptor type 2 member 4 [Chinchilla lanigera]